MLTDEEVARLFHETYERLAPSFGYETNKHTRTFFPLSTNGQLMIATCGIVRRAIEQAAVAAERERLLVVADQIQLALEWYSDEACALARHLQGGAHTDGVLASLTVLALDAGKRANEAIRALPAAG
jgi:hypothetical protein